MSRPGAADVRPDAPEHLDQGECRRLLGSRHVGRLAYCGPFGPRIVPMAYALVGDLLLLRTGLGSEASRQVPQRWVAFEVDNLDEVIRTGWTVLVRGFAELLPLEALRARDRPSWPPWAEGEGPLGLRLAFSNLTGRRVDAS